MQIINQTQGTVLADRAVIARTPLARMRGLLGKREFHGGEALVIMGCNSIHMFFMRFPIDVIFLDSRDRVVGLREGIRPFTLSPVFWKANRAIEVPEGTVASSRTQPGDILLLK